MGIFGSRAHYCTCPKNNNPDPSKFKIKDFVEIGFGRYLVAKINYPDATNFEGDKILVFKNVTKANLLARTKIDPHFAKGEDIVARFKPSKVWWQMAVAMFTDLYEAELKNDG